MTLWKEKLTLTGDRFRILACFARYILEDLMTVLQKWPYRFR